MAIVYNTSIVRSGLVLHLDAANPKSYPGSGTAWRDLSGNSNHGILTNGPTYSANNLGYFSFDGSNDYVNFPSYSQPAYFTTTSFTWNLWVYPLRNLNNDVYMGNRFGGTGTNFVKITSNNWEYYTTSLGGFMPINNWINISLIKNQTNLYYYRNGLLHAQTTSTVEKASQPFYVGGDPGGEYSLSRIANVSVYNRALTPLEVSQNFEATRGRYGI